MSTATPLRDGIFGDFNEWYREQDRSRRPFWRTQASLFIELWKWITKMFILFSFFTLYF